MLLSLFLQYINSAALTRVVSYQLWSSQLQISTLMHTVHVNLSIPAQPQPIT